MAKVEAPRPAHGHRGDASVKATVGFNTDADTVGVVGIVDAELTSGEDIVEGKELADGTELEEVETINQVKGDDPPSERSARVTLLA